MRGRPREGAHDGQEPDYRFSMANERTFLAWMRTALALLAAAVAITELTPDAHHLRQAVAVVLTGLALLISATAYPRWAANQRAMRNHQPLPTTALRPVMGTVFVLVGIGVLVLTVAS